MNIKRRKILGNKGVTLLELLVAVAISVIVIATIAYFMERSTKNYKNANEEVTLQMEAQTILNQLNDLIMEAYNVKYEAQVLKIYQNTENYIITFEAENDRLTFEKVQVGNASTGNSVLFGQYVDDFRVVDTGVDDTNKTIEITLDLKYNSKTYNKTSSVTLRNRIKAVSD
jgi:prepilin-type N-terminal cleavage/methylation domain-containing protein